MICKYMNKIFLTTGLLFLFSFCNAENQMKRPNGVPKEAKFDRKKNIYNLNIKNVLDLAREFPLVYLTESVPTTLRKMIIF